MLVSTLDGRLSALDVKEEGKLLWSVQADSRPLLSSSISKLEVYYIYAFIRIKYYSIKSVNLMTVCFNIQNSMEMHICNN